VNHGEETFSGKSVANQVRNAHDADTAGASTLMPREQSSCYRNHN
jgi:hypothetical protein